MSISHLNNLLFLCVRLITRHCFSPGALVWVLPNQQEPASLVIFATASFYMMDGSQGTCNLWALYVPALLYNVALYIAV